MLEALSLWPRERLFWTLAVSYIAVVDATSWLTKSLPGCIVQPIVREPKPGETLTFPIPAECPTLDLFVFGKFALLIGSVIRGEWFTIVSIIIAIAVVWHLISVYHSKQNDNRDRGQNAYSCGPLNKGKNDQKTDRPYSQCLPKNSPIGWFWYLDPVAKFTLVLCLVGLLQFLTFEKTDLTLRNTLIANNRAWIWPEVSIGSDLVFENGDAKITLAYTLSNSGPAPAINVEVDPKISPLLFGRGDPKTGKIQMPSNALQALREECSANAKIRILAIPHGFSFGEVIFPSRNVVSAVRLTIPKAEIDAALERSFYKTVTPQVRFCVTYGFAVDDKLRETGRLFDIYLSDPSVAGGMNQIDPAVGTVPRQMLRLHPNFLGSSYAN